MRISEMAEATGVSARMLRYYEKLELLVPASRTSAGYRTYDDADVERVLHIEGLRGLGLSLAEVKRALDDPHFSFTEVIDELISQSHMRLREEKKLYDQLRAVRGSRANDWEAALSVVQLLQNLRSHDPALRQTSALRLRPEADPRQIARTALKEDNLNAAGALTWSVLQAGPDALQEVARALANGDESVRLRAVDILSQAEDTEPYVIDALEDSSIKVRRLAALRLGERGGAQAFEELIGMIMEGDHDTEAADVLALAPSWQDTALARIEGLLGDPATTLGQRARLVQSLAEFDNSTVLLESLTNDPALPIALTAKAILHTRGLSSDETSR